jgi:hypothetical protein
LNHQINQRSWDRLQVGMPTSDGCLKKNHFFPNKHRLFSLSPWRSRSSSSRNVTSTECRDARWLLVFHLVVEDPPGVVDSIFRVTVFPWQ